MTHARDRDTRPPRLAVGARVDVWVQVPRGGFIKPRSGGGIDFIAPLPCPFNYGEVPELEGADGDPLDAVVLGERRAAGTRHAVVVQGAVGFIDAGRNDRKLICGGRRPGPVARAAIVAWFRGYALAKRALYLLRGELAAARPSATRCTGWEVLPPPAQEPE